MARARAPLALVLALLCGAISRPASAVAPHRDWRTIVTPRFRVHFHEGTANAARRVAQIAEEVIDPIASVLGNPPEGPIHLALTDETDVANAFTQVLPETIIQVLLAVPDPGGGLGDYDDYLRTILIHELVHGVHLTTVGGLPRMFNRIFGRHLSPQFAQPLWVIEGIAVWLESRLTGAGRIQSARFEAVLRAQLLDGVFPRLDEVSSGRRRFPGGTSPYLYGGRFIDFIARRYGEDAIARTAAHYGSRIVPYGMNIVSRQVIGKDYEELWAEFKAEERERAEELLAAPRAEGLLLGRRVDRTAETVLRPRWAGSGAVAFVELPRDGDSRLVVVDLLERAPADPDAPIASGRTLASLRTSEGTGAFTPDGRRYVAVISDVHERAFSFRDLEVIDLISGARTRRTHGARLSDPDVSRQAVIVAVAQEANETSLVTLSIDGGEPPAKLLETPEGHHVSAPRWSPDGRTIAAVMNEPGKGKRIVLVDAETGALTDLTDPGAQDDSPIWAPDGERLVFSSDRGGVHNIHQIDLLSREILRLTNVETAAFEPVLDPSGRRLLYVHGTSNGYELRLVELDSERLRAPGSPGWRTIGTSSASAIAYPVERYTAWESLIPKAYLPTTGTDGYGDTIGVRVDGADALGYHGYQLRVDYGIESKKIGYGLSYQNRMSSMPIDVSSSLIATRRPRAFAALSGRERDESIWRLRFGATVPLGVWDLGQSVSFNYGIELRRGLGDPPLDPFQGAPAPFADLTLGSLGATWAVSTVRGFADSISAAAGMGFDVSLRINHPWLGSDLSVVDLSTHWTGYLQLPWLSHHVLASRLAAGASSGDPGGRGVYVLGGLPIRDIFTDIVERSSYGPDVLRGYPEGFLRGPSFYLATLEYRLPLVFIERGIETLPAYLDRLHASFYVEAGDTPAGPIALSRAKAAVGGEVRIEAVFGYHAYGVTARIGFARGLMEGAINNPYLVIGGSF